MVDHERRHGETMNYFTLTFQKAAVAVQGMSREIKKSINTTSPFRGGERVKQHGMKQPTKSHTDVLFFKFQYSRSARDALGSTAERQLGPAAHLPGIYTPALAPGILKKGTFFFFFFFPSLTDDNIIQ